mmetsp:Transcript_56317/g.163339  ORF Transcript_56317/g.163339 Transcript_56317/m.163339 type:complete len:225 (+) Transcript_56317:475-1149(+)
MSLPKSKPQSMELSQWGDPLCKEPVSTGAPGGLALSEHTLGEFEEARYARRGTVRELRCDGSDQSTGCAAALLALGEPELLRSVGDAQSPEKAVAPTTAGEAGVFRRVSTPELRCVADDASGSTRASPARGEADRLRYVMTARGDEGDGDAAAPSALGEADPLRGACAACTLACSASMAGMCSSPVAQAEGKVWVESLNVNGAARATVFADKARNDSPAFEKTS